MDQPTDEFEHTEQQLKRTLRITLVSGALWAFGLSLLPLGVSRIVPFAIGAGALYSLWRGLPEVMIDYVRTRRGPIYMKAMNIILPSIWIVGSALLARPFMVIFDSDLLPNTGVILVLGAVMLTALVNIFLVFSNVVAMMRS